MEVTLTAEDAEGGLGFVSAVGTDYTDAYTKAQALIPQTDANQSSYVQTGKPRQYNENC